MFAKAQMYFPRALHGDGGVTNALWLWTETLHRAGWEIELLYDPALPALPSRTLPPDVRLRPLAHRGSGRRTVPRGLAAALDDDALLILHSGYTGFNIVAGEVARRRGIPYVVTPHGAYDPHVRAKRGLIRPAWEIAERRMLSGALGVHVFFEPEIDHVRALAPTASTFVAATAAELHEKVWVGPGPERYVAWLGRYDVRHKGLDRLLDAMALVPPNRRPALRIRGRDHKDSRQLLERMVVQRGLAGSVSVGGPVDGAEKQEFLDRAGAYVHPARWESYGIALVENLARGLPCITTTNTHLAAPLRERDAAFVVDGSVSGLARGLEAAAAGELAAFGARGQEFVRSVLSHENAADDFLRGIAASAGDRR